ncbi:SEC-C metal-binding domain-containing protein [Spiribacter halobius]|uniref:SEC-C metal-binding domain-containing protein n=1 Tax=Sediminicurvatus halobius TaxID=2182432 RepID=UPI0018EE491B|nr:SEC-C metal-binding domain-containing protein [Spiribacter halobius]UEX76835.1 SEC-C domain-containing protein [Spiribacter halobius]
MTQILDPIARDAIEAFEKANRELRRVLRVPEGSMQRPSLHPMQRPAKSRIHPVTYVREHPKVGRNQPCPCGSGRKFKRCCINSWE